MEIEEFSVHPARYHFPRVDWVTEWIGEWVAENGMVAEGFDADEAVDDEVRAAFDAALDLWAGKVRYSMANELLATHTVTLDADGEPLLDGAPMYITRKEPHHDDAEDSDLPAPGQLPPGRTDAVDPAPVGGPDRDRH
jgi:hypothetical protein